MESVSCLLNVLAQITSLYFYFNWSSVNFICRGKPGVKKAKVSCCKKATNGSSF